MIHEFIDYKKRTKNNGTNNEKTFRDSIETCSAEQSGSEWPSTTFIPPWLRNNLGLKPKNNNTIGAPVHKTEKLGPEIKNQNQFEPIEGEELKSTVEEDDHKLCVSFQKECEERIFQTSESLQKLPLPGDHNRQENKTVNDIPVIRQMKHKFVDLESSSTDSELNPPILRGRNFNIMETEGSLETSIDNSQLKNEEKKRQKLLKKKHKIYHRIASVLGEIDVESLLEEKAREILENYSKKKVHRTASDIKQFEAKLILLHTKMSLEKLTPEDIRLLQEIKAQAGSKENFEKLMRYVRDVNLREILETQCCILKSMQSNKMVKDKKTRLVEEERTFVSTDDENDIKRFSELLKKNHTQEEKKKCLEEVRNYFERKRRTRLTKCWAVSAQPKEGGSEEKKEIANDKTNSKKTLSYGSSANWKSKFRMSNVEVVRKAVDETVQKFMELYQFQVSPNVMSSMKNNLLKGIECYSFENEPPLAKHQDVPCNVEGAEPVRTEGTTLENDQMKQLKNELEYYINNACDYGVRLNVQSIVMEGDSQNSNGKNLEFVYSFAKNSVEQKKSEIMSNAKMTLSLNDVEVQVDRSLNTTNAKTQTQELMTACEIYIQTERDLQKSIDVQTEGTYAIEMQSLKESDVSAGLYRMVKSKQPGRFYLYPEKEEQSNNSSKEKKDLQKGDTFEEVEFRQKRCGPGKSKPDKKVREINVPEFLQIDDTESKKSEDFSGAPEKKECVWLWDGERINSGTDLKAHVESLFREKLQEMSHVFQESVLHSGFPFGNEDVRFRLEDKARNFGERSFETQGFMDPVVPTSEEKLVKNPCTQNSEQAFLSLNPRTGRTSGKSQQSSKTVFLRKRRRIRAKRNGQSRRSIVDLKKAMHLMNKCLNKRRIKSEVESSLKDSLCDSGTNLESNRSTYSKNTSDDHLTHVTFGTKDDLSGRNIKNAEMVNELVQTNSGSVAENQGSSHRIEDKMQWELIEKVLHLVNRKEKKSLWNDVRDLIKSKIGKDIDNEEGKEVWIQIEQDMSRASEEKARQSVLAKGYYAKNKGDVEVEIDLTLNDLERIIRRRERSCRRRSVLCRRKCKSLRQSSIGHSTSNIASTQQFRNILRNVSRSPTGSILEETLGLLK